MNFIETDLKGSFVISLTPSGDSRGWFARTYCKNEFLQIGHTKEWVQLNHSFTGSKGTIRGMHFQYPPFGEIKMLRCISGAILDVIVDLRYDSQTFLEWYSIELSSENKKMLYIPEGFAHGFQTLEDNVELLYHHSEYYNAGAEGGILYNDPLLDIEWPIPATEISKRDLSHLQLTSKFKKII